MGAVRLPSPGAGEVAPLGSREDTIHWESSIPTTLALAWIVTLLLMARDGPLERGEWVEFPRFRKSWLKSGLCRPTEYRTDVLICQ